MRHKSAVENGLTVLVIEDDRVDAEAIDRMLEESSGNQWAVTHVDCLSDGLDRLGQNRIDVVLLDLGLPDSRGLETLGKFRAEAPNLPVVVLTGADDEMIGLAAVKHGAQEYLVKGQADHNLLVRSLRYAIERNRLITERLNAEEDRKALQNRIRHNQKMEAIGQLAAGVAHEFNNLLVGILCNAENILRSSGNDLPERFLRPLRDIEEAGTLAADVTRQLLSFAQKTSPCVTLFDVNRVVTDSIRMLLPHLGDLITLNTDLSPEPSNVQADKCVIEQAVVNLGINARDAMPDGGTLTIQTRLVSLNAEEVSADCDPGPYVQLSVTDNGCGMSPETVERIFEPFFSMKCAGNGTGLGLSVVFADVTRNGGFISVDSRLTEGSVFRIFLPQSQSSAANVESGTDCPTGELGGRETILVCDDNALALRSFVALLRSFGYSALSASSGREAIEMAESHSDVISLLITDVSMPEMDGQQLADTLTQLRPELKVIYVSGYGEEVLDLAEAGQVEFLQKPTPGKVLAQRIREVLDKRRAC